MYMRHLLILVGLLALALAGCASKHTRTAHYESTEVSVGEDAYDEI